MYICHDITPVNYKIHFKQKPGVTMWYENHDLKVYNDTNRTRMHSSRMRTACSLTVSHGICHTCPNPAMHAPLPCMPPTMHTPLPCTPYHTHPLPCTLLHHTCPTTAKHAPTMHAPLPRTPPSLWTDTCENITFANFVCGR